MLIRNASRLKTGVPSAHLQELLERTTPAVLRAWVERISIPRHFVVNAEENAATAEWIAKDLASWGYEVQFQGRYRNVIATPPVMGDRVIVVGAHYDSVPETPGADDNGSAVAAMLGCAQLHRSDHAPFWKANIPSIMWTDTSEFRNPHYHAATDTPDTLNYPFLTQVTQALTAVVLTQAEKLVIG